MAKPDTRRRGERLGPATAAPRLHSCGKLRHRRTSGGVEQARCPRQMSWSTDRSRSAREIAALMWEEPAAPWAMLARRPTSDAQGPWAAAPPRRSVERGHQALSGDDCRHDGDALIAQISLRDDSAHHRQDAAVAATFCCARTNERRDAGLGRVGGSRAVERAVGQYRPTRGWAQHEVTGEDEDSSRSGESDHVRDMLSVVISFPERLCGHR